MGNNTNKINRTIKMFSVLSKYGFEDIIARSHIEKIIPKKFINVNEKVDKILQNDAGADNLNVKEKLTQEFNINPDDYFEFIDEKPFATASISQVFKAQLKTGEKVVLKIKRENIKEIIEADLLIMKDLSKIIENYNEESKKINLLKIVETFEKSIHNELSFLQELENIERFQRQFKEDDSISVHKTFRQLSNNNILCLEFIDGIKITDTNTLEKEGFNPK
mgnify:CR=1 FL=1